jgi:hypothetical protein
LLAKLSAKGRGYSKMSDCSILSAVLVKRSIYCTYLSARLNYYAVPVEGKTLILRAAPGANLRLSVLDALRRQKTRSISIFLSHNFSLRAV